MAKVIVKTDDGQQMGQLDIQEWVLFDDENWNEFKINLTALIMNAIEEDKES